MLRLRTRAGVVVIGFVMPLSMQDFLALRKI
jgi:hypothetical protein